MSPTASFGRSAARSRLLFQYIPGKTSRPRRVNLGFMKLSEALGMVIRERRLAMGLSQGDLAIAAGLHKNFIGLVERGKTAAAIDSVEVIATALKCRASQLLAAAERTRKAADG